MEVAKVIEVFLVGASIGAGLMHVYYVLREVREVEKRSSHNQTTKR